MNLADLRSTLSMESTQLYMATLTHYSTEPLTTGPDYDPLPLLLALAGDVHPNPGLSRYHCSVCFKNVTSQSTSYLCTRCSHWVHSRCSGLRNAVDYRKANGWICMLTCYDLSSFGEMIRREANTFFLIQSICINLHKKILSELMEKKVKQQSH